MRNATRPRKIAKVDLHPVSCMHSSQEPNQENSPLPPNEGMESRVGTPK